MSRYRGSATTTLYVRNLSDRVRYEDLRRLFAKYGKVIDVTIPLDFYSGLPKGYCFVEFESPRDAEEAQYRMDRQRLFNREIEVEFARGDRKTPGEMRNRDRDGGSRSYGRRGGGGRDDYDRGHDRYRSRSRSRGDRRGGDRDRERDRERERERGGGSGGVSDRERGSRHTKSREPSYSRSKSRASRSYSKNRSPSPRHHGKSESRERSRSRDRSGSRTRGSPRRNDRSPKGDNMSRSQSPA